MDENEVSMNDEVWKVRVRGEWLQIVDGKGRERHRSKGLLLAGTFLAGHLAERDFGDSSDNASAALRMRADSFPTDELP